MKTLSRRSFLKLSGVTLVALVGGSVWRAVDQGVFETGRGPAYEPWVDWQDDADGPIGLVGAAILAANPHNSQPWLFRVGEKQIDLYADPSRSLGTVDPCLREKYIGLGCALENMALAARARGYAADITLLPDPADPAHAARITLTPGPVTVTELFSAIPARHTNRARYTDLPSGALPALDALDDADDIRLDWLTTDEDRARFAALNLAAAEAFVADAQQSADSGRWFRQDWDDIQAKRDGITLDAQSSPAVMTVMGKLLPPLSQEENDRYWLKALRAQVESAPAFGLICVPDRRDKPALLRAGRLYQRLHLWASASGLAMQPLNQILERIDREQSLRRASAFDADLHHLVPAGGQVVMPFRFGTPTVESLPSPRRSVEMVSLGWNG
jgi:hypothetical protein